MHPIIIKEQKYLTPGPSKLEGPLPKFCQNSSKFVKFSNFDGYVYYEI